MNKRKSLIAFSTFVSFFGALTFHPVLVFIFGLLFLAMIIEGAVRAFQRHAVVAALFLIFLLPVFIFWAFAEFFTSDNLEKTIED